MRRATTFLPIQTESVLGYPIPAHGLSGGFMRAGVPLITSPHKAARSLESMSILAVTGQQKPAARWIEAPAACGVTRKPQEDSR
jgi:hypothetical protein